MTQLLRVVASAMRTADRWVADVMNRWVCRVHSPEMWVVELDGHPVTWPVCSLCRTVWPCQQRIDAEIRLGAPSQ